MALVWLIPQGCSDETTAPDRLGLHAHDSHGNNELSILKSEHSYPEQARVWSKAGSPLTNITDMLSLTLLHSEMTLAFPLFNIWGWHCETAPCPSVETNDNQQFSDPSFTKFTSDDQPLTEPCWNIKVTDDKGKSVQGGETSQSLCSEVNTVPNDPRFIRNTETVSVENLYNTLKCRWQLQRSRSHWPGKQIF